MDRWLTNQNQNIKETPMKIIDDEGQEYQITETTLDKPTVWVIKGNMPTNEYHKLSHLLNRLRDKMPNAIMPEIVYLPEGVSIQIQHIKDLIIKWGNIVKMCEEAATQVLLKGEPHDPQIKILEVPARINGGGSNDLDS